MADVPPAEYDLIIRNVRVLDPANDVDGIGDVAVKDGLIVSGVWTCSSISGYASHALVLVCECTASASAYEYAC